MKVRLNALLLALTVALLPAMVFGQDDVAAEKADDTAAVAVEKKEVKKDDGKKGAGVFTMGEIVVRDRAIANIEDSSTTTEITAEDIKAHGDRNLADSLQMVPGVQTFQHPKGHVRFNMRGYDMDKVALLVDGIPVTDVYEANVDVSRLSVQNASKIVVNRGVCSALYGTTGTVGSINVVSKKPDALFAEGSVEYGIVEDYTINVAQGMPIGNFYYWLTGNISHEGPYTVSSKLDKKTRREWYDKLINHTLYGTTGPDDAAELLYLNDTDEWPHTEKTVYNINTKMGYEIMEGLEAGVTASFSHSDSERYLLHLNNTSSYSYSQLTSQVQWSSPKDNPMPMTPVNPTILANAFVWPDVYWYEVAPYLSFEKGSFSLRMNGYYTVKSDYVDAYTAEDHTTVPFSWGGTHSNWVNSTGGFNIFPSYKFNEWNKLNASILVRFDRHLEREKVMENYATLTSLKPPRRTSDLPNAVANHGYDWYDLKVMQGQMLTLALEDEISLLDSIMITAGISYDMFNFSKYEEIPFTAYASTNSQMVKQDLPEDDSLLFGTNDSFNPVVGVVYEPMKDFLKLRGSFAMKAKIPTMAQYGSSANEELKPERSYNSNAGFELNLLDGIVNFRSDYFLTRYDDKLERILIDAEYLYTNVDGVLSQGIESTVNAVYEKLFGIMDASCGLSYVFVKTKNLSDVDDSNVNMGDKFEQKPEHYLTFDVRMDFVTQTSFTFWGTFTAGEIMYAMNEDLTPPANGDTTTPYSTNYYKEVKLHNPVKLNIKLSQNFLTHYTAYVMVKNLLDDYNSDPFNPGPGRQYYFGLQAKL